MTDRAAWLEARAEISDLIHRYARNIRYGDIDACHELFTEDAVFETGEGGFSATGEARNLRRIEGRKAIIAKLASSASGGVCPLIHNLLIDVQGHEASSSCVMTAIIMATGASLLGEYRDRFRREDTWRFTARRYILVRNGTVSPGH